MDEKEKERYDEMMAQASITEGTQKGAAENMRYYLQEQEKGIVNVQLEVDSIKEDVYHLLRQDVYKIEEGGAGKWVEIPNKSQRTLSDWGVDRIMQVIHFYVNKNTLLSNFNEEQINRLMLKFVKELNDLILLKYQLLFRTASFKECKNIILDRIEEQEKMKIFSLEILGKIPDKGKIHEDLLREMELTLDKEMNKVREEQRKEKLREYGLILAQLEVMVYSTLNRAFRGEERGSIRRHTTISELIGNRPNQSSQKQGGLFSWVRS